MAPLGAPPGGEGQAGMWRGQLRNLLVLSHFLSLNGQSCPHRVLTILCFQASSGEALSLGVRAAVALVTVCMVKAASVQTSALGESGTPGDVRREDVGSGLRPYDRLKRVGFCEAWGGYSSWEVEQRAGRVELGEGT